MVAIAPAGGSGAGVIQVTHPGREPPFPAPGMEPATVNVPDCSGHVAVAVASVALPKTIELVVLAPLAKMARPAMTQVSEANDITNAIA